MRQSVLIEATRKTKFLLERMESTEDVDYGVGEYGEGKSELSKKDFVDYSGHRKTILLKYGNNILAQKEVWRKMKEIDHWTRRFIADVEHHEGKEAPFTDRSVRNQYARMIDPTFDNWCHHYYVNIC